MNIIAAIIAFIMSLFSFGVKDKAKTQEPPKPATTTVEKRVDDPLGPPIRYNPDTDMYETPYESWPAKH